ncbi:MAG: glycosyltransferase family 1 protein [Gemmatimonadaceae bacterium]|nr:glycosyltransferase family 1 protein [Gemmatimonadaceae bacterium]NUR33693.1 glycosyltransferase family 1 protein [Gemmatimonadaceae bacterium]NUS97221.1 glycosyltransferase family 1 protein [Gemmatimonadaceae bacterium]
MPSALFIYHTGHLDSNGGGVQACSREYFAELEVAGFQLTPVEIPSDRRLLTRLRRRIWADPYSSWTDFDDAVRRVLAADPHPEWVFINQHYLGPLAPLLQRVLPAHTRYVMLSHGLESTDYLHEMREIGEGPGASATAARKLMLGQRLVQEARHLRAFDHVFCLSDFERGIEHWLGASRVTMIPRTVTPAPLDWRPEGMRLGFVGTIDHYPNREGLLLFLREYGQLGGRGEVRVVGGPASSGKALASEHRSVRYLGPLSNELLEQEARTWSCFLHPIFCYARGASTKLATPLAWEIPVATTTTGQRGYRWTEGRLPTADTPRDFALLADSMLEPSRAAEAREEVRKVARSSPTIEEIGALMRSALGIG